MCQVVFFKMHSYFLTNLEYRQSYLDCKKRFDYDQFQEYDSKCKADGRYPYNITATNFARYMAIPTVVYEQNYPSTSRISVGYCVGHITLAIINLIIQYIIVTDCVIPVLSDPKL